MGTDMTFNKDVDYIISGNKVVLCNQKNGYWLRITTELFAYYQEANKLGYNKQKFLESFLDLGDREYVKEIIKDMENIGIIGCKESEADREITIEVTNRCNLNCFHCCIDANSVLSELDTNEILNMINKIIKWQPKSIVLSGGEPLVREDIMKIMEYLRKNFSGKILLSTNALLINETNIDILTRDISQIDISIDGVDEESCSKIRGKGVFDKVMEKIRFLQNHGYDKISLSMAVGDNNEDLVEKFYELNRKMGTHPIVRNLTFVGRGKSERNKLNPKQGEHAFTKIEDNKYDPARVFYGNCLYKNNKYFIRCQGDVFCCPMITEERYSETNIKDITELDKINNEKMFELKNLLLDENKKCSSCKVQKFCWNCLAVIKANTENHEMDGYCKKVKSFYNKVILGE